MPRPTDERRSLFADAESLERRRAPTLANAGYPFVRHGDGGDEDNNNIGIDRRVRARARGRRRRVGTERRAWGDDDAMGVRRMGRAVGVRGGWERGECAEGVRARGGCD